MIMGIDTHFVYSMCKCFKWNKELDHKVWKKKQVVLNK